MKHTGIITWGIACSMLLFACKQKEKTAGDKDGPSISITEPGNGTGYMPGDTIFLKAHIEDESELQDISVMLHYSGGDVTLWPDAPIILGNVKEYDINDLYVDNFPVDETATITFEAIDKHDNITDKNVSINLAH